MRLAIGKMRVFGPIEIAFISFASKFVAMRCSGQSRLEFQSGRGQPHSPAGAGLARWPACHRIREVLECGCPLPLSHIAARGRAKLLAVIVFVFLLCVTCTAQETSAPTQNESALRARTLYSEAEARFKKEPKDVEAAWQFGRACFDLAEFSTNSTERAEIAEQGIAACKQALSRNRELATAHYYLGMNLGEVAQTRGLSALKLVDQMEREFELARTLDESLDYAGPDRNLGLLYRDAPSWISVGSKSKARKHLIRAVELAPNYPENRLNLAEGFVKWSDHNGARRELKTLEELWPKARTNFVGAAWIPSWVDWELRLKQLKKKVDQPSKALESPRQKTTEK